ncbi:hypothetical protein [Actinoplanes awajinensis]|uniref:hypothetical protein n=1 Tax=Actinoplanes awajinensis TaxID=135946 RepID=UPI0012F8707A|nr:hypothetical protein [Actinoplanes awajinensis]
MLEYMWSVEAARDVHVYGRRGQKQYGLDIVGEDRGRRRFVCQVRRLQAITPTEIRAAVVDYAGPPRISGEPATARRFDASRFVLATAASTHDDTALVDEITALQGEYRGDLEIEVIGIEHLSVKLREAAGIVAAFFGPAWAHAFCGVEPPASSPGHATGFGLLEGPLAEQGLEHMATHAEQVRETEPTVAAGICRAIADKLEASGYPGHAEVFRHRAGDDLRRAGDFAGAFDMFWQLGFDSLLRGDTQARLAEFSNRMPVLDEVRQAKSTVLTTALAWYGQGSDLTTSIPALRNVLDADDPQALALVTVVVEQAVVDQLFSTDPPKPMVGAEPPADLMTLADALLAIGERALASTGPASRAWRARLRCALADAGLERSHRARNSTTVDQAYGSLISDVTAGRIPPGPAAMVHARAGRAYAVAGEPDQAIDSWRRAVMAALPEFGGDAREAFRSMTRVVNSRGEVLLPDLARISQAVPNRRTFLAAASDPAIAALDALRDRSVQQAFLSVRRCIWEARLSGHLYDEGWAQATFADVLKAADRPDAELTNRIAAGDGKRAAAAAAARSDWLDVLEQLQYGTPWAVAAAAQVLAAEADLVPDDAVRQILHRLIELAETAATSPAVAGQPPGAAFHALTSFAHRIDADHFGSLVQLVRPHLVEANRLTEPSIGIVRELYRALPEHRDELAVLLTAALDQSHQAHAWRAVRALHEPADRLESITRDRARNGDDDAIDSLSQWRVATPEVRVAARRSAANLLRTPTGHPRTSWGFGGSNATLTAMRVATLMTDGDNEDLPPEALALAQPEEGPIEPDVMAITAAGPVQPLAAAVVNKLLDLAADSHDMAVSRADAVAALAVLVEVMPANTQLDIARRLVALAREPEFGPQDDAEVYGADPLRGFRMNLGGRTLASRALRTAAQAYKSALASDPALADADLATGMRTLAEAMLRSDDGTEAQDAAASLAIIAELVPVDLLRLASHPSSEVRALVMHGWVATAGHPSSLPLQLAADPDARVRRSVAQFANTVVAILGQADSVELVNRLRTDRAWSVRDRLDRALSDSGGT